MPSFLVQLKEIWNRLPMSGRISSIAAAVVTIGLLSTVIYYGSQPEYGVLFSDLKPADAQTIVEKLKTDNVPYSLSNNGTTIQVPSSRITELRLQVASTGTLSGGHVGFDLFDKTTFGATDFAQQVNYRRAIEGELSKTLEGMDEIDSARVHISPKKESVFAEKEDPAKASVMLRVRQGKELSEERTEAVVNLIASAVEGLDASNVSVLDTNGRVLSAAGRGGKNGSYSDASMFHAQLEAKQKFEAENTARVIALLEPVVGEGRVRSNVSAEIDFSQVEQTEEKYDPKSQVVRSQQSSQEARNTNVPAQNGAVGARSNDPTTAPATPATTTPAARTSGDQRQATTTNYEIDKTVKKTVGGGGHVNRLTISVVVDSKMVNGVETARTPEEIQKIQDLVGAAIGINQQRGDSVVVQTMAFDKPAAEEKTAETFLDRNKQFVPSAIKYGALVLVALLLFMFVIRPARKSLRVAMAPSAETNLLTEGTNEDGTEVASLEQRTGETQLPEGTAPQLLTVAELESQMDASNLAMTQEAVRAENLKKLVAEQTLSNPEIVANTLRGWLREA